MSWKRYLVQKKKNNRYCNYSSFDDKKDAVLVAQLINGDSCRIFDRNEKKYIHIKELKQ